MSQNQTISERFDQVKKQFSSNREELLNLFILKMPAKEMEGFDRNSLLLLAEIEFIEILNNVTSEVIKQFKEYHADTDRPGR